MSASSFWIIRYMSFSHIGYIPQCRMNGKFRGHCVESLLGSPVPFSVHRTIIITNTLIKQTGSYYIITTFSFIWDISQLYPVYLDDINVITLNFGSALVSCNINNIILVHNYNLTTLSLCIKCYCIVVNLLVSFIAANLVSYKAIMSEW